MVIPWQVFIGIYVLVSLLMVSRVDYSKVFPDIYRIGGKPFLVLSIILAILSIGLFSVWAIFGFMSIYTIVGIVLYVSKIDPAQETERGGRIAEQATGSKGGPHGFRCDCHHRRVGGGNIGRA